MALPLRRTSPKVVKKITQLYWTYGDDEVPLNGQSRFYTDLNLHVNTENYETGEMVEVVIQNGKNVAEEIKTLNFSVSINADGTGKLKNVFKNESLDISSHC